MAGADLSSAGMVREGCRLCGFFGPPRMPRRGVASTQCLRQPLRNEGQRLELLASTERALIVVLATLLFRVE